MKFLNRLLIHAVGMVIYLDVYLNIQVLAVINIMASLGYGLVCVVKRQSVQRGGLK